MGAKSAVKLRKRGIAYKCQDCGRKLMTPDALAAHQRTAHNIISRRRAHKSIKLDKGFIKEKIQSQIPTQSERTQVTETTDDTKMKKNTIEFECPKCFKMFPTYFPALKHIQKYHCVTKQNVAVPPNHPNLINPIRIEQCVKCLRKVKSIETHVCDQAFDPPKSIDNVRLCVCAACEEWFPSLIAFDLHVVNVHSDHIESMFFPTCVEFLKWKTEVENQTNVSYSTLEKIGSKRYYHCNNNSEPHSRSDKNQICPSMLIVQEFPKGIQVHFYHKHYNHSASEYTKVSLKYKKYSISSFLQQAKEYNSLLQLKPDEDDLYMQFKTLMEGIVVDAAKINIATLKIILGKALEITSILTNYDEEFDDEPMRNSNQILSDEQITKALEEPLSKRKMAVNTNITTTPKNTSDLVAVKRRHTDIELPVVKHDSTNVGSLRVKRKNTEVQTDISDAQEISSTFDDLLVKADIEQDCPKIVNSFSLADSLKRCKPVVSLTEKLDDAPKIQSDDEKKLQLNGEPSSFNDSYKDFVVKNFPYMESIASRTRSKPTLKTRIGQIKPSQYKVDVKTKYLPVSPQVYDNKTKPVSITNQIVQNTRSLLRNVSETTETVQVLGKKTSGVDEKTKSFSPKIANDSKLRNANGRNEISSKIVDDQTKSKIANDSKLRNANGRNEISSKIVHDQTKSKNANDSKLRNANGRNEISSKIVDDQTKSVTFSTKIVDGETNVLPKIDVKIGTDLKETANTKGKTQVAKVTPRAKMVSRVNSRASFDKPKVDIKYEVKERDDDCNILILKI